MHKAPAIKCKTTHMTVVTQPKFCTPAVKKIRLLIMISLHFTKCNFFSAVNSDFNLILTFSLHEPATVVCHREVQGIAHFMELISGALGWSLIWGQGRKLLLGQRQAEGSFWVVDSVMCNCDRATQLHLCFYFPL